MVESAIDRSFLSDCTEATLDRILEDAILLELPAGGIAYREYDQERFAIILKGQIRAYISSKDGRQITVKYAAPGELFGLPSLVSGPVPVRVQALRESSIIVIAPSAIDEACRKEPTIGMKIAQEVGNDFCDLLVSLTDNIFAPLPVRLARHLLSLAAMTEEGLAVTFFQRELADAVGSVREVISRILRDFQEDGVVELRQGGLLIVDTARLKAIARGTYEKD